MIGAVGLRDFFAPGYGGNDYVANFEDGTDSISLIGFNNGLDFADFAAVQAITVANGPIGIYLSFANGGHLAVNGLSLANFDAFDVILAPNQA